MSREDPYSRLYHRVSDEFPNVWDDDRALAAWVRLLVIADAAWPTRVPVPASVNRKVLALLVACELVTINRDTYTVRGLDKHRSERRAAATAAGLARAEHALSGRSANGHIHRAASGEPNHTEPNKRTDKRDGIGTVRASRGPVDPS